MVVWIQRESNSATFVYSEHKTGDPRSLFCCKKDDSTLGKDTAQLLVVVAR